MSDERFHKFSLQLIHVSGVPCSMQVKPGPQPYPTCIACNIMTELWFAGCAESPPRTKSAHRISWRGCSLMIWQRYFTPVDSDGMAKIHINYQSKWLFQLYRLHQFFIATQGRSRCIHELARLTKFYIFSKQITVLLVQYGPLITQIRISRVPI